MREHLVPAQALRMRRRTRAERDELLRGDERAWDAGRDDHETDERAYAFREPIRDSLPPTVPDAHPTVRLTRAV